MVQSNLNKKVLVIIPILVGVFLVSYAWAGYLDFIPVFKDARLGFNVLEGLPVYEQGRLWRLNNTFYEISTKGQIIYLNSTLPIANYSTCYDVYFRISQSPYKIEFRIYPLLGVIKQNCV